MSGGKPDPLWKGIDPSSSNGHTSRHSRPINPEHSGKGFIERSKPLSKLFAKGDDLPTFQEDITDRLEETGMDTIACIPDPEDPTTMNHVVTEQARYTDLEHAKKISAGNFSRFDTMDKENDSAAKQFLMASLHPDLKSELREKVEKTDSFAIVWLALVHMLVTRSMMRFERSKDHIRALRPPQYAGQNIELLSNDFCKAAKELWSAGQYDHSPLTMIKAFRDDENDLCGY